LGKETGRWVLGLYPLQSKTRPRERNKLEMGINLSSQNDSKTTYKESPWPACSGYQTGRLCIWSEIKEDQGWRGVLIKELISCQH